MLVIILDNNIRSNFPYPRDYHTEFGSYLYAPSVIEYLRQQNNKHNMNFVEVKCRDGLVIRCEQNYFIKFGGRSWYISYNYRSFIYISPHNLIVQENISNFIPYLEKDIIQNEERCRKPSFLTIESIIGHDNIKIVYKKKTYIVDSRLTKEVLEFMAAARIIESFSWCDRELRRILNLNGEK